MHSSLSVVLPAHNEAQNLVRLVREAVRTLEGVRVDFEIVIVDDGSNDDTPSLGALLVARDARIRMIRHQKRRGYGAALRTGFEAAKCDLLFFTDADGQFRFDELPEFLDRIREADLVLGYRVSRQDAWHRKLNSAIGNFLARTLLGLRTRDINCAYKLMRRAPLEKLRLRADGAMVNAELLVLAQRDGWRCLQLPVTHYPRQHGRATGASPLVILKTIQEFFQLRRRLMCSRPANPKGSAWGRSMAMFASRPKI